MGEYKSIVEEAKQTVDNTQAQMDSYRSLIKAYNYYQNEDFLRAGDEIINIDPTLLSDDTIGIYNSIYESVSTEAYDAYVFAGANAAYEKNWEDAVAYLEKAIEIEMDEDTLNLLAACCMNGGMNDKAIQYYQMILDNYPNTRSADNAAYGITVLGGTPNYDNQVINTDTDG